MHAYIYTTMVVVVGWFVIVTRYVVCHELVAVCEGLFRDSRSRFGELSVVTNNFA